MTGNAELSGQTVLVIGGSSGIGLETARRARAEGAGLILTARNADRLHRAGLELGAHIATFDAADLDRVAMFFGELSSSVDHVVVSGPGACFAPAEPAADPADVDVIAYDLLATHVARSAAAVIRSGGTLVFFGTTMEGQLSPNRGPTSTLSTVTKALALELAPIRVNLIATGFIETPRSTRALGDQLAARRERLRATLPIRRTVTAGDVAALAVHLMINGAVTGATFDIDGGQQLIEAPHLQ